MFGDIVLYVFVLVGLKFLVSEFVLRILGIFGLKLFWFWFLGLFIIVVLGVVVFKVLFILILNDDDNDVVGKFVDICGLKEELNIEDDEDIVVFVCGGDWFIFDYEIFEVCLCGSVIILVLEKLFDIGWLEDWF